MKTFIVLFQFKPVLRWYYYVAEESVTVRGLDSVSRMLLSSPQPIPKFRNFAELLAILFGNVAEIGTFQQYLN